MKTIKNKTYNMSIVFEILQKFSKKTNLKNLGYLPRWIILLIDIFIISFSFFITKILLKGIGLDEDSSKNMIFFLSFVFTHFFYFWRFRTYSGIIRHSSIVDAIQVLICESAVLLTLYLANTIYYISFDHKLFLNTSLFISIILSYCFLLFFRIIVKIVFEQFSTLAEDIKKKNVLIFGSGELAISVAISITTEKANRFKIKGFIDPKSNSAYNRIINLPVYNINRRPSVIARINNVKAIILADNTIENEDRVALIEDCINYNIKVLVVPPLIDINETSNISSKIRNIKIEDLLERKPINLDSSKISAQIENKVILISGAAGSIGSEIVFQVAKFNPSKIILLDQAETPLHTIGLELCKFNVSTKIISKVSDIRNITTLETIFKEYKPDIVYHAAAYKHVPLMEENPSQAIHTNIIGTKNLADLSVKYNIKRFVMVSTDKAVNPSNVMGCSKRIAEKYVQSLSLKLKHKSNSETKFITTRFGNVLGSNGSVVPLFTKQIENGGPITITHPDIIRYFMTIPEACQLVLEAGTMGNGGEIYIFDMGKPVKIIDLAKKMIKFAGLNPEIDIEIKIVGLRPGEKLYEELLNDTSKTLATYHEKIMIAEDIHEDYELIDNHIKDLLQLTLQHDNHSIVKKMKEIVPEFKSMNSQFEMLDKTI